MTSWVPPVVPHRYHFNVSLGPEMEGWLSQHVGSREREATERILGQMRQDFGQMGEFVGALICWAKSAEVAVLKHEGWERHLVDLRGQVKVVSGGIAKMEEKVQTLEGVWGEMHQTVLGMTGHCEGARQLSAVMPGKVDQIAEQLMRVSVEVGTQRVAIEEMGKRIEEHAGQMLTRQMGMEMKGEIEQDKDTNVGGTGPRCRGKSRSLWGHGTGGGLFASRSRGSEKASRGVHRGQKGGERGKGRE